VSCLLTLIGSAHTPREDTVIAEVVDWHLDPPHQAVWTDVNRPRWAGGTRLVVKIAGAKVLALTGVLVDGRTREDDPIEVDGRTLRFRYDVRWDARPASWVAVERVGEPFDEPTRAARFISFDDFRRAYRALHAEDPPRQDVGHWASEQPSARGA
jgi:hypothetical protein